MDRGVWARIGSTLVGIWLMAAPALLGYGAPAEINDRIAGPVAATFAIIAISGVTRPLRRVNTATGLWLLVAPWLLGYGGGVQTLNDMVAGALLLLFSLVKGTVDSRFGGGWSALSNSPHARHATADSLQRGER